ncbi:hypothetical protein DPEC_G00022040 [Dallia pectoralis]|uniref:Uncharacterized protein n=1 Tax=Dallia pectoralis TaxID=75939 RepID=A0ACC2HGA3_DALPE|nr:hypothetical protein DPEC_G00022040 [Dallia pectoralis]
MDLYLDFFLALTICKTVVVSRATMAQTQRQRASGCLRPGFFQSPGNLLRTALSKTFKFSGVCHPLSFWQPMTKKDLDTDHTSGQQIATAKARWYKLSMIVIWFLIFKLFFMFAPAIMLGVKVMFQQKHYWTSRSSTVLATSQSTPNPPSAHTNVSPPPDHNNYVLSNTPAPSPLIQARHLERLDPDTPGNSGARSGGGNY